MVGIRDQKLSEALQLDDALTLTTALAKVRAKAMISKQSQSLAQLATPHGLRQTLEKQIQLQKQPVAHATNRTVVETVRNLAFSVARHLSTSALAALHASLHATLVEKGALGHSVSTEKGRDSSRRGLI